MNYFRGVGMFGSAFLGAHLMRGAAAAALLAWAIVHQTAHPWLSLGAGVACVSRRLDVGAGAPRSMKLGTIRSPRWDL